MKKTAMVSLATMIFLSCSKSDDTTPPPSGNNKVTKVYLENIGSTNNNPNQLQLFDGSTTIGTYKVDATGTLKIEFRGLGGRTMLQGSARHAVSTGALADWDMSDNDTIRITNSGISTNYITSSAAGINGGYYTTVNLGENEAAVFTRINTYASAAGGMAVLIFKKQ